MLSLFSLSVTAFKSSSSLSAVKGRNLLTTASTVQQGDNDIHCASQHHNEQTGAPRNGEEDIALKPVVDKPNKPSKRNNFKGVDNMLVIPVNTLPLPSFVCQV